VRAPWHSGSHSYVESGKAAARLFRRRSGKPGSKNAMRGSSTLTCRSSIPIIICGIVRDIDIFWRISWLMSDPVTISAFINSTQALKAAAELGQYAATKHAMKAVADSLRDEVNASGVRVMSLFLGRTASERQRAIFAAEGRPYPPDRLIQPADVAKLVLFLLQLPRASEVTDIVMRPMQKT